MKKTRAIELLSHELRKEEDVAEWIVEQDDVYTIDDLHHQEEYCEALRMAIRALGGATV